MMFFDNQMNNCHDVAKIGVTVLYTPDPEGVTRSPNCFKIFLQLLKRYFDAEAVSRRP